MLLNFLLFYFLSFWVLGVLYKDNFLPNKLEELGNNYCIGFLIGLSECKFCLNTWIMSFFAVCLAAYSNELYICGWGVIGASIAAHFNSHHRC